MSEQMTAAVTRSILGAVLSGLLTLLTVYQTDRSWEEAALSAGIVAVTYIITRGGIEGIADSRRAANGDVVPSDVGAYLMPLDKTKR